MEKYYWIKCGDGSLTVACYCENQWTFVGNDETFSDNTFELMNATVIEELNQPPKTR